MFRFLLKIFRRKPIDTKKVILYKQAIKAIEVFILLSDWEKASQSIEEIEFKEKKALHNFLKTLREKDDEETQKKKKEIIEENRKRCSQLNKLKTKLTKHKRKYEKKKSEARLKVKFKKAQIEINQLIGKKQHSESLQFLQIFLEDNKSEGKVIDFYNKQKKYIIKQMEKQKVADEEHMKKSAKTEALSLIGETIKVEPEKDKKQKGFFGKLKNKLIFYKNLKENIRKKKLLDEINILIEEDSKVKNSIAEKKLANIHKGLVKELTNSKVDGYELYGKILGADKISGDTFGFHDDTTKYNFFLGDATGHGIRAGFIITLLSRLFQQYVKNNSLQSIIYEVNNGLKQDLQTRNFITGVFFEINKKDKEVINYVGMGHEPMLIYRDETQTIEKIIPGGLAAGIRTIKEKDNIKVKTITLNHNDILIIYSDGIIENKNENGELYGIERLQNVFSKVATYDKNINRIYEYIINDIQAFKGGSNFLDDASILLFKRNKDKDILNQKSDYIKNISTKEGLKRSEVKNLEGKSKEEINAEIENIKKKREIKRIIKTLETLYYTGEIIKLKQECIRFIKGGYIDKKINYFLKKAIEKEKTYRFEQKNIKLNSKYNVLKELLKKGDYNTVIGEIEEIITKDGNV